VVLLSVIISSLFFERKLTTMKLPWKLLFLAWLLSFSSRFYQFYSTRHKEAHKPIGIIRSGIWAIHFGMDKNLQNTEYMIANVIKAMDLDVIALVETDTNRNLMGPRDMVGDIAARLGWYVHRGPPTLTSNWGCALLSRFPLEGARGMTLPSPDGEIACAISAVLNVEGHRVHFLMNHNGQEEDIIGRELQTKAMAELVEKEHPDLPVVFGGYVVASPNSINYHYLFRNDRGTDGPLHDLIPDDYDRWCLYVGYRPASAERQEDIVPVSMARLHHGGISDTEMQMTAFALYPRGFVIDKNELLTRGSFSLEKICENQQDYCKFYFHRNSILIN